MTRAKKLDTAFRVCRGGCNTKIWCERPTVCDDCRRFFDWYFGSERARANAVPPRSKVGTAVERGKVLSAYMRQAAR